LARKLSKICSDRLTIAEQRAAALALHETRLPSVFPSFSAIFNRKMQKLPLFSCILLRNEGINGQAFLQAECGIV